MRGLIKPLNKDVVPIPASHKTSLKAVIEALVWDSAPTITREISRLLPYWRFLYFWALAFIPSLCGQEDNGKQKKKKKKKKGEINLNGKPKIRQPRYLKVALAQSPPRSAMEVRSSEN